ncbi:MAG: ComEA family DNA-binding protein [candidate division WOR-3 bacterium]
MSRQEKVVLLILSMAFLIGAGVNTFKKIARAKRARSSPVVVKTAKDSTESPPLLDINQATKEQLEALPGIGPVLAQRIITYREKSGGFKSISQLRKVSGIGPKRLSAIKDFITVSKPLPRSKSAATAPAPESTQR